MFLATVGRFLAGWSLTVDVGREAPACCKETGTIVPVFGGRRTLKCVRCVRALGGNDCGLQNVCVASEEFSEREVVEVDSVNRSPTRLGAGDVNGFM